MCKRKHIFNTKLQGESHPLPLLSVNLPAMLSPDSGKSRGIPRKMDTKKMDTKKMDTKKCVYEKKICVYIYNVYICVVIHSNK